VKIQLKEMHCTSKFLILVAIKPWINLAFERWQIPLPIGKGFLNNVYLCFLGDIQLEICNILLPTLKVVMDHKI
jgi:hypothetical protein